MAKTKYIYVTFRYPQWWGNVYKDNQKQAVRCTTEEEAQKVALEVCSWASAKNVRINRCGRIDKSAIIRDAYQIFV